MITTTSTDVTTTGTDWTTTSAAAALDPCPPAGSLVNVELGRVLTQYREAERLTGYLRVVLGQVEEVVRAACAIPSAFDVRGAAGEPLTFLGRRLGVQRCHCVCDAQPVFGFAYDDPRPGPPIAGFCEAGTWRGCDGTSDLCVRDDEAFRGLLLARRYQMLGLYDLDSLGAALRHVWGEAAWIPAAGRGRVVVAPGCDLTAEEGRRLAVTLRVLPIAPGVEIAVHYGAAPIVGFGAGWVGFCARLAPGVVPGFSGDCASPWPVAGFCADAAEGAPTWAACLPAPVPAGVWLCPTVVDPYRCDDDPPTPVFGFEGGADDAPPVAGFGDEGVWATCA